jgi:tetratricopeptide (TPR) repeat protein
MENNNDQLNQNQSADVSVKRMSMKNIILILIAILAVIGVIAGVVLHQRNIKHGADYNRSEIKNLPDDQRKKELEAKVKDLTAQAEKDGSYTTLIQLAEANNDLGNYQGMVDVLNRIPQNQQNNRVWADYALAYKGMGDNAKAQGNIEKALVIDDGIADYWVIYFDVVSGVPADQLDAKYQKALIATKNDLRLVISYAKFLEKNGNIAKAVAYWETARNTDPAHASDYEKEIARLRPPQ